MTAGGALTYLHEFVTAATDGAGPTALTRANDGNLYGMTATGGAFDRGTAFKMTMGGMVTIVHHFGGGALEGGVPLAALIQANDGRLYGTTSAGGAFGLGTVFRMTLEGAVTVVHHFSGSPTDGARPRTALVQASDGNFYGTTSAGGTLGGTAFRITPGGDGRADVAVYRELTGEWFIHRSLDGGISQLGWGSPALGDSVRRY